MQELQTTGSTPPEGWWHIEKHSGERFPEKGTFVHDYLLFLKMIKDHRKATGGDLSIGWEGRLQDEMCQEHPDYPCKHLAPYIERHLTLNDVKQFLKTADTFIEGGGKFVDQELAESRANVCSRCPANHPVSGCLGCGGFVSLAMEFLNGRKLKRDDELKSCAHCGCYLKAKVWLPLDAIQDGIEYPSYCWVTKERNGQ